ncbi:hypothetical protein DFH08DRAFT_869102 [Mycena albidolilacea]|uniref:Mitochondrial intermembrane space import and assembly protein 40 n=1 Tax=Mycena albidolilacea TaxID=1033008 RepID=A0AAD6ZZT1_9AGAR|nr:hypothetical protein DFH08DRAFT_869102 [Mycena albidolilacea]
MLSRVSRARVPFRRYLHTNPFPPTSTTTKYALAAGTLAAAVFLGTRTAHADNGSRKFEAPSPTPEDFQSFLTKRLEENPSPDQAAVRALTARAEQGQREKPTPSEPAPAAVPTSAEEEEASGGDSGGGAYNPETGEINWDCACLGGMAHGPCGPEFREAFSCFIYSEDEPKGINCVEKFQGMQTCFREHPETYASEIEEDEAAEKELQGSLSEPPKDEGTLPQADTDKASSTDISASTSPSPSAPKPSEDAPSEQ